MANLISWGKVYCYTWFGDTDRTTLSIQNASAPPCFAPANLIAEEYRDRVLAAGGTVEGYDCLVAAIQDLGEENYYEVFGTYFERMRESGATVEGEACAINQLFELN